MAEIFFWSGLLLLLHTYVLYPLMLLAAEAVSSVARSVRFAKDGVERRIHSGDHFSPSVSIVVAAHNESACIGAKLENSLGLDYPASQLEVLIGSDGSTDGTDDIVRSCKDRRVRLSSAARGGKGSVLNRCIPLASGDIVVLTDANTVLDRKAVRHLVRHFRDPRVGAVCGRLRLFNPRKKEFEESAYWTYESIIKFFEGKRGAVVGANGGLYAIRRKLFSPLPPSAIVDDFVIPGRILERGFKVLYDAQAVAHEETSEDYQVEFARRTRIAAGNFQSLKWLHRMLRPSAGFQAFAFWSHKLLRWVAPALLAWVFIFNLLLWEQPFYRALLFLQVAFYGLAAVGRVGMVRGRLGRLASVAYYFVVMNAALAVGFWRFMRNGQKPAWERQRSAMARPTGSSVA